MIKSITFILFSLSISIAYGSITTGVLAANEVICCESYGLGSNMEKCCESYEWTSANECAVPDGFVGGGKQIVEDGMCPSNDIHGTDTTHVSGSNTGCFIDYLSN